MAAFTTRPEIRGTFGAVASTHWTASAIGMGMLERGGNAFDAAVATGFALQILEPHLNGPGGDLPVLYHAASSGRTEVLCAQGTAPAAATPEAMRAAGAGPLIPGSGLLATVVPGAFDGWATLLRDHGTVTLRDALAPTIAYARNGHPLLPRAAGVIAGLAEAFARDWPSSAAIWAPGGRPPEPWARLCLPDLAATYERLAAIADGGATRTAGIDAACAAWREGFVAEAIFDFLGRGAQPDGAGGHAAALLAPGDMAGWRATVEAPVTLDYEGWRIHKPGPWSQGPVLLQALAILRGFDLAAMDPLGAPFVHTVIEAMKLAYADREAHYGDPDHAEIPLDRLLSEDYAAARRALIGDRASTAQRPGRLPGLEPLADAAIARAARDHGLSDVPPQEPTMAHLTRRPGDTVHLDVVDRWGNVVSATPSGGWLQSSPAIPGLGFCLNTRAQMFWLDEGLPTTLAPGRRPRTTLSPTLAERDGARLALGTPGGDQQDQWQLIWLLRVIHHGMDLQQAMDAPLFHSMHFPSSFYPRAADPGAMMIEPAFGAAVLDDLRARGHRVTVAEPWTVGRLTCALREADGTVRAAATPRLMQAYAVGR